MILEVAEFTTLEELAVDITDAAANNPHSIFSENHPLKIELDKDNFDKLQKELRSYGTYGGIRKEDELMANKWQVGEHYVTFQIAKDGEATEDS
jgi:hypothetical protein